MVPPYSVSNIPHLPPASSLTRHSPGGKLPVPSEEVMSNYQNESPQSNLNHITPISKKSNLTKMSSPSQLMMANRQPYSNAGSIERIYINRPQQALQGLSNPYLKEAQMYVSGVSPQEMSGGLPITASKKSLNYINITGDARPTGVLGIKKAEKDLIMRRYKYNHQMNDNIQRVALIYGQPSSNQQLGGSMPTNNSPYIYNLNSQYINNPYLNSKMNA